FPKTGVGIVGIEPPSSYFVAARHVPNRQLLSMPFRSELEHCATRAQAWPSAVYFENDFSPLMRCAGEHLVSGAHIIQRQEGAYLRGQPSTVKQPRNAVQPFRSHLSVEEYRARVGSLRYRGIGHDRNKNSTGFQGAV